MIQQVVDVFELKCMLKTFCGCLRFVSFHMYLTNTQLLSSLLFAWLRFTFPFILQVIKPHHPLKVSIVFFVEVVYYLFCLAFYSCVLVFLKVFIKGAVYFRLFYDCVGISLFFSLYEYEHLKYVGYINENRIGICVFKYPSLLYRSVL